MERLLSCDWGTSSFRLYLFDVASKNIIAEQTTNNGISRTFELWKRMEEPEENRFKFYWRVLVSHLVKMEEQTNISLRDIPILISGMASSSIGMMELPYKKFPFRLDGADLNFRLIQTDKNDRNQELLIVSGACTDLNAMRGEETQLVGCNYQDPGKSIFIFPGTHSKHIHVDNGLAIDCKTYMTGELFALLSGKSILSSSIEVNDQFEKENHIASFEEGVSLGLQSNLLEHIFDVRMNQLLNKKDKQANYHFLSGLLIGSELKGIADLQFEKIVIVADDSQSNRYGQAFEWLTRNKGIPRPFFKEAVQSVLDGQSRIYSIAKEGK